MTKAMNTIDEIRALYEKLQTLSTKTATNIDIEEERFGAWFFDAAVANTNSRRSNTRINKARYHCTSDTARTSKEVQTENSSEIEATRASLVAKIKTDIEDSYESDINGMFRLTFEDIPVSGRMDIMEAMLANNIYKQEMGILLLVQRI